MTDIVDDLMHGYPSALRIRAAEEIKRLRADAAPNTYGVIDRGGNVVYSASWPEACYDHIKDMMEVDELCHEVKHWVVRGIRILRTEGV